MGLICVIYVWLIFKINWDIAELSIICEHEEYRNLEYKLSDFAADGKDKKDKSNSKIKAIYDCNAGLRRNGTRNSLAIMKLDAMTLEMFKTIEV